MILLSGTRSLYEYHLPPVGSANGSWIRHAPVAAGGLAQIYPGPLLPTNSPSFFVTTANKWLTKMNFDGSNLEVEDTRSRYLDSTKSES